MCLSTGSIRIRITVYSLLVHLYLKSFDFSERFPPPPIRLSIHEENDFLLGSCNHILI